MNTLVVNCYAGPGAGKTTCAWDVAAELKKRGINCEYVPEYAKELVWEGDLEKLNNQEQLFKEQARRLERLRDKVEVIVTDSPILMSHVYGKNNSPEFTARINSEYDRYYNFNLFIKRGKEFHQEGRVQNLDESKELDYKIRRMLKENNIYFGTYSHANLKYIADNIERNLEKVRKLPEKTVGGTIAEAQTDEKFYGMDKVGNYFITDSVTLNGSTFVVGYNANAPNSYATWEKKGDEYINGNYFTDEIHAKANMLSRAMYGETEIANETFMSVFKNVDHEEAMAKNIAERVAAGHPDITPEEIIASNDYLDRMDTLNIHSEAFDPDAFINAMENAIDYGDSISDEQYALYQQLTEERANAEIAETAVEDFDMEM